MNRESAEDAASDHQPKGAAPISCSNGIMPGHRRGFQPPLGAGVLSPGHRAHHPIVRLIEATRELPGSRWNKLWICHSDGLRTTKTAVLYRRNIGLRFGDGSSVY